jgi:hypothetical protein
MNKCISRVSVRQTSKVVALVYGVLAAPIWILAVLRLFSRTASSSELSPLWLFMSPLIYGVCAYLIALVTCLAYNVVARVVGGIEFTVGERGLDVAEVKGTSASN